MSLINSNHLSTLSENELNKITADVNLELTKRKLEKDYDILKHGFTKFGMEFESGIYVVKIDELKRLHDTIAAKEGFFFPQMFACRINGMIRTLEIYPSSSEYECMFYEYNSEHDYACTGAYSSAHGLTKEEALELLQMCTNIDFK